MKVILYARSYNTEECAQSQFDQLRQALENKNATTIVAAYLDVGPNVDHHRPGIEQALKDVWGNRGVALWAVSPDRVGRTAREVLALERVVRDWGGTVHYLKSMQELRDGLG